MAPSLSKSLFRRYAISLALIFSHPIFSEELYQVQVEAPPKIKAMINQYTDLITQRLEPEVDQELIEAMAATAHEQIAELLKTEGYFQPQIEINKQSENLWYIKVTPGEAVTINETLTAIDGPIKDDPEYQTRLDKAKSAWTLTTGNRFQQAAWSASKKSALLSLTTVRYPLAQLTESRALIDPNTNHAILIMRFDSGPEIRFGPIEVKGNKRYPAKIVADMADFSVGTPYSEQKLLDYQNALEQDAHYSNAIVIPDYKRIQDGKVPLEVTVTEVPRQKIELGLNYDTADGFGYRLALDHYNIFKRGYTGSLLADIKRDEKKLSLGLAFPRQANNYSHTINVSYTDSYLQRVQTKALTAGAWRIREHGNIRARFGLEFIKEETYIDAERTGPDNKYNKDAHALLATFAWTKRDIDNLLRPRNGYLLDTTISATPGKVASSAALVRGYLRSGYYLTPWHEKYGTLVTRMEIGQVWTTNAKDIPETLLFRTGGNSSVRGYKYHSLGIQDGRAVRGGRVMATGSVEYQIPVVKDWAVATFYDFGNAAESWSSFNISSSYGVGIRWFSPIAPLSFDMANAVEDKRWRWNISLGLAF